MTYIGTKKFLIEVQRGNVAGHSMVHKFGHNGGVPNGTFELISNVSAPSSFLLTAPTTVRVKSGGNANDTTAGTGAQQIIIEGVDSSLNYNTDTLTTAGASASAASSVSFWRIFRAYPGNVGTYGGANTGDVVIENSAGGTDLLQLDAGDGSSQYGGYSIPTGVTGYLLRVHLYSSSKEEASFRMFTRANFNDLTTPFSPKRLRRFWEGVSTPTESDFEGPIILPALTDIWFEARGDGAVTSVSVAFDVLLVAD